MSAGLVLVAVLGVATLCAVVAWARVELWRAREVDKFLRHYRAQFPDLCPLCGFSRWGRQHGFASAFEPLPPHPCPEAELTERVLIGEAHRWRR